VINPEVILAKTGESKLLSEIALTGDIAACPANIASLCMCIAALAEERKLWLEPSKEMVQAGMSELNALLKEMYDEDGQLVEPTDDQVSDAVVFVLQAMAGKRNG
jgi:hypothetical protein